jgi:hypothetical protein
MDGFLMHDRAYHWMIYRSINDLENHAAHQILYFLIVIVGTIL